MALTQTELMNLADEMSRKRDEVRPEALIGGGFICLEPMCPTKQQLTLATKEMDTLREVIADQGGRLNALQEKALKEIDTETAKKIVQETLNSHEILSKQKIIESLNLDNAKSKDLISQLANKLKELEEEQRLTKSRMDIDTEYKENFDKLKKLKDTVKVHERDFKRLEELKTGLQKWMDINTIYVKELESKKEKEEREHKDMVNKLAKLRIFNDKLEAEFNARKNKVWKIFNREGKDAEFKKLMEGI